MTVHSIVKPPALAHGLLQWALPKGDDGATLRGDLLEELTLRAQRSPSAARWWLALPGRRALGPLSVRSESRVGPRPHRSGSRQSARSLAGAPGVTAAIVATLTIGIAAATAIFSIVNAMLLRPLPYASSDRLMWMAETTARGNLMSLSWPNLLDWKARLSSFDDIAASRAATFTVSGLGDATRIEARQSTWNLLPLLGVTPALGRPFTAADDAPGPVHAVIVSHNFWRQFLGSDPQVIGRRVILDSAPHEIVGVLPAGFRYFRDDAVWEPLGVQSADRNFKERGDHPGFYAVGRLKTGVTEEAARTELDAVTAALSREYPNTNSGNGARLQSLSSHIVGDLRPALLAVLAAVGLLLLIACVNVASLLITRGATRRHELSVRTALGCGRPRLIRQLLIESLLLSVAGGTLGLMAGWGLLSILVALAPPSLPRLDEVRLDTSVLLFALGITLVSGLAFGLLPAIQVTGVTGQLDLVRAGRSGGAASHRLRRGLLIVEVAVALILLTGAGLMIRTMRHLTTTDPGFDPHGLLTLRYSIEGQAVTDDSIRAFHENVVARTRAIPGVRNAALTLSLPIDGSYWGSVFTVNDQPVPERKDLPAAAFTPVSPTYFETFGLRLLAGRTFTASDGPSSPVVAVVNESFARKFWLHDNPIGKKLKQGWPEWTTPWREIVGVVSDVKLDGVEVGTPIQVYLPIAQSPMRMMALVVRTSPGVAPPTAAVRAMMRDLDPGQPIYEIQTMDEMMGLAVARERLSMVILAVFAVIALVLASTGLYGVVSHGVAERTGEIGLRMALGASRRQVLGLFLRQGASLIAIGLAIGLAGAIALSRFLRELLFDVTPTDPATLWSVAVVLAVVALAACYLPARRATRVSPTVALLGH